MAAMNGTERQRRYRERALRDSDGTLLTRLQVMLAKKTGTVPVFRPFSAGAKPLAVFTAIFTLPFIGVAKKRPLSFPDSDYRGEKRKTITNR